MLRWQTAGESHGEALVAMIEGLPAGIHVTTKDIVGALARRRLGYGRGARMKFEQDKVRMLTGVRFGETIGSPVAIEIANTEWPKWTEVMSADPLDHDIPREGRNAPLSRPRPGHADLTGMRKYGFDDARPVLERSSARETASRVALGEVAKQFLEQTLGIRTVSHVLSIGGAGITADPQNAVLPKPEDLEALDASPVRTLDKTAEQQMIARIDEAKENADTLGGVIEVVVYGVPAGIGTYVESDRRLSAADRDHGVDTFQTGLQRDVYRLSVGNARSFDFNVAISVSLDFASAVNRLSQRIDHAADDRIAYGNLHQTARSLYYVAFLDGFRIPQKNGTYIAFFQVHGHAVNAVRQFQQFTGHAVFKAIYMGDTVADFKNRTYFIDIEVYFVIFNLFFNDRCDFI